MRRQVLALIGAAALGASLLGTLPAQAAQPRDDFALNPPVNVRVLDGPVVGSVIVDWDPPQVAPGLDDTSVTGYQVRYAEDGSSDYTELAWSSSTITETTVRNLLTSKSFVFEVRARNGSTASDLSDWSAPSRPAQPTQPVGPPSAIALTPAEGVVIVSWTAPSSGANGYQIQYQLASSGPGAGWDPTPPVSSNGSVTSKPVTDLTAGTQYRFRVRSYNAENNTSDWVVADGTSSPLAGPGAPTNVRAVPGDSSAVVYWNPPSGTAPESYRVQYRVNNSSAAWTPANGLTATGTSYNVTGLTNGTSYFFRVVAVRGNAVSAPADSAQPVTPTASSVVPAAPTSVSAIPGDSALSVNWVMPANQPVSFYELQYTVNNQWVPATPINTGRTDTHYVLTGLANGVGYNVRVRAVNGALVSGWTQMANVVTPLAVPGPPLGVSGVAGNGQVTLTWTAPPTIGPMSPITGYRVQYSNNGGAVWAPAPDVITPVTTTVVTGLTNGTSYVFRVRAAGYTGDGAWSAPSAPVTPPGGPSAPTNVVAAAGNAQATVSWSPSTSPSGAVIGYRVVASPGGASCTTSAVPPSAPSANCVVTGLTNGQPYTFTVVAVTSTAVSAPSNPSAAVIPTAPSATIRITNSGRNGTQVFARGTTTGITSGTSLTAQVKYKARGSWQPAGQITVQDDGTFNWTTNTGKKVWIRFTGGGATSNVSIVAAR